MAPPRRRASASIVALFPVVYIVSSAFNAQNNLSSATVIPSQLTTQATSPTCCTTTIKANTGAIQDAPYLHWFLNSIIDRRLTALFTTILGALAAYAFSRFRFTRPATRDAAASC